MSFASTVKKELCQNTATELSKLKAECYAMLLFAKRFSYNEIIFTTENNYAAARFVDLMTILFSPLIEKQTTLKAVKKKTQLYTIKIIDSLECEKIFTYFGHSKSDVTLRINRANIEEDYNKSDFLRGAFLACGSVNDPEKNYHLEFCVPYKSLCTDLSTLIREIDETQIISKQILRTGSFVEYIKDSEQIADLLTYMGAYNCAMEIMGAKAMKQLRNVINRKRNSEVANLGKTAAASAKQINAIEKIKNNIGLESLPPQLLQLANIRLENPELSLRDLGQMMSPPISRSGVNHRIEKILEIADSIKSEE